MSKHNQAIGVFDSGIGGLTLAHAITQQMPHENIFYFGDTAHLPYGDKSTAALQAYSIKICNLLMAQQCKVILIACNSASSAAFELVKEYVGSRALVMNVIDPVIEYIGQEYAGQKVGLIGTKRTVKSNVYKKKIDKLAKGIQLKSLATPLLAPMIEEGFFNNTISKSIIAEYLKHTNLKEIKSLILGCTHYPLIAKDIDAYFEKKVQIIDSTAIVAKRLKSLLTENNLLREDLPVQHQFYVSDFTESFKKSTRIFFGEEVNLEHYALWD